MNANCFVVLLIALVIVHLPQVQFPPSSIQVMKRMDAVRVLVIEAVITEHATTPLRGTIHHQQHPTRNHPHAVVANHHQEVANTAREIAHSNARWPINGTRRHRLVFQWTLRTEHFNNIFLAGHILLIVSHQEGTFACTGSCTARLD